MPVAESEPVVKSARSSRQKRGEKKLEAVAVAAADAAPATEETP